MKQKNANFRSIRKRRRQKFDLRIRMVFFVTLELIFSVIVAYSLSFMFDMCIALIKLLTGWNFSLPPIISFLISLGTVIGICLFVGTVATYLLSLWLLRPMKKMVGAISRIADGDFSVRLYTRSSAQEVQELYSGFNLMAEELQSTEILQTDFVSNVSHEFKTPISAIEGYSMLLQDNDNLTDEQKEYVDKILFNTKRLSTLTGSILLLSKLENQSIITDRTRYSLDEQILQTIVALEPLWEKKNVDFDVDMESVQYFGSEILTYHVWSNLIGNAIKFGPEGGTVKIRLGRIKNDIEFVVEDDGVGIAQTEINHIFDKFYQGNGPQKGSGNGLGLTLVKKILDIVEGSIKAENREEGGCRFTVILHDVEQV